MFVMGIALDTRSGSPIVILKDKENRKALPIWIGSAEASAIIRKIEEIKVERPMTHDLICDFFKKAGYTLDKVEINDVDSETYFATLVFSGKEGQEVTLDARPSDAIAIAIRTESPIYVTANVIANGSVTTDQGKDDEEAEEFRQFIQNIKPSDFQKLINDDKDFDL